jgi:hypothetical protein
VRTRAVGRFGRGRKQLVWHKQQPAISTATSYVHLLCSALLCPLHRAAVLAAVVTVLSYVAAVRLTYFSLHFVLLQQTLLIHSKALSAAPLPPATAADGIPAESLTLDETTTLLRGPSGSSVALTVAPRGPAQQTPRQLLLERRPLPQPAVKVRHTAAAAAVAPSACSASTQLYKQWQEVAASMFAACLVFSVLRYSPQPTPYRYRQQALLALVAACRRLSCRCLMGAWCSTCGCTTSRTRPLQG